MRHLTVFLTNLLDSFIVSFLNTFLFVHNLPWQFPFDLSIFNFSNCLRCIKSDSDPPLGFSLRYPFPLGMSGSDSICLLQCHGFHAVECFTSYIRCLRHISSNMSRFASSIVESCNSSTYVELLTVIDLDLTYFQRSLFSFHRT